MIGPVNFSLNEECGCLVSGFDLPPAILMSHARRWTGALLEATKLKKEIDLFAYRLVPSKLPTRLKEIAALAAETPGISIRSFDMRYFDRDFRILAEIFNDAWSNNWGFVPFSSEEINALLSELRHPFKGEYGRFVLFHGDPVGVMAALPNINEVIAAFHGRLLPFNWARLLFALKYQRIRSARIPLLGLKRAHQSSPLGSAFLALLLRDLVCLAGFYSLDWVEFSWVLETNTTMRKLAEMVAGPPVKTYRLYSKSLT